MKRLRLCVCVLTCCLATYAAPVSGSNPPGPHNQHGNEPVWEHNLFSAGYDPITFCGGTVSAIILEEGTEREITPQGEPQVEVTERPTPLGPAVQRTYSWTTVQGYRLEYRITRIGNDAFTLSAALTNGSLNPIRLERFWLLKTPENGMTVTGEPSDWMLSSTDPEARRWGTLDRRLPTERELLQEGAFCRNYLISGGDETKINDPAWRGFGDNMSLYHRSGRGVTFAAVDTVADINFDIRVEGTQMRLDIRCDMTGVLVESGETRPSDEVLVAIRPWGAAMQARSRWIADVAGVRNTKKPVFGWCSWYRSKTDVTAEEVCSLADYVGKNRDRIPMEVVQIDEGWHRSRYDWRENGKFSMGMDSIARCIRKAGMVPGVWLCPVNPEVMPFEAGSPRRVFPAEWYINYGTGEPSMTRLDPTQPEARAHMRKVLQTLYDQGYRYFKLDFSYIPNDSRSFYNPKVTHLQAQRALFRLYREAIGEESYLMACCYQQRTIVPYADANRIGTDCCAEEGFCRPLASDGLPGNLWSPYFPILSMASSCYENGILGNSDPDVTYLAYTHKTKPAQLLTFHSFIGTLGGAVLTSDLLYLPEFDQPQNIRLFEILNPSAREKGVSFSGGFDPYGREFGCVVERSYGNSVNLLLWNPEHKQAARPDHDPCSAGEDRKAVPRLVAVGRGLPGYPRQRFPRAAGGSLRTQIAAPDRTFRGSQPDRIQSAHQYGRHRGALVRTAAGQTADYPRSRRRRTQRQTLHLFGRAAFAGRFDELGCFRMQTAGNRPRLCGHADRPGPGAARNSHPPDRSRRGPRTTNRTERQSPCGEMG